MPGTVRTLALAGVAALAAAFAAQAQEDDKAVGIGLVATGFMYNTKYFAEKGFAAPTRGTICRIRSTGSSWSSRRSTTPTACTRW